MKFVWLFLGTCTMFTVINGNQNVGEGIRVPNSKSTVRGNFRCTAFGTNRDTTTESITTHDDHDTINSTRGQTTNQDHTQSSTSRAMTTTPLCTQNKEDHPRSCSESIQNKATSQICMECIDSEGYLMKEDCAPPTECARCSSQVSNKPVYNRRCTKQLTCTNTHLSWVRYQCNNKCENQGGVYRCHCNNTSDRQTCEIMYRDCQEWYHANFSVDGIYIIKPNDWPEEPFAVYCNMTKNDGWTVLQRRFNGSVDFYRNWTSYKEGFGSLQHEHWLGNEKLRYITKQKGYKLRINLVDQLGQHYIAKYNHFRIENETNGYKLKINRFTGDAGDCLTKHWGMNFTTYDQSNDYIHDKNCREFKYDAWWYNDCPLSNLNGNYTGGSTNIFWRKLGSNSTSAVKFNITFTEMKIRPK